MYSNCLFKTANGDGDISLLSSLITNFRTGVLLSVQKLYNFVFFSPIMANQVENCPILVLRMFSDTSQHFFKLFLLLLFFLSVLLFSQLYFPFIGCTATDNVLTYFEKNKSICFSSKYHSLLLIAHNDNFNFFNFKYYFKVNIWK